MISGQTSSQTSSQEPEPAPSRVRALLRTAASVLHIPALRALARLGALAAAIVLLGPLDAPANRDGLPAKAAPTASASEAWPETLASAHQRVLRAQAAFDAANAAYAETLYDAASKDADVAASDGRRDVARTELARAKSALPKLVRRARAAGVSPNKLALYEDSP